jgi:hypothetical protein
MKTIKRAIATTFLALAAVFAGNATAQELKDGSKVTITNEGTGYKMDGGTAFTLIAQGKDKSGDAIYYISKKEKDGTEYLLADNKEGAKTGWDTKEKKEPTKWILHDNGGGWSIIHAASGENTVSHVEGQPVLERNQGAKHQKWVIKVQ